MENLIEIVKVIAANLYEYKHIIIAIVGGLVAVWLVFFLIGAIFSMITYAIKWTILMIVMVISRTIAFILRKIFEVFKWIYTKIRYKVKYTSVGKGI